MLVAGDTHCNARWTCHLATLALAHDCDLVLQVGDFGYFPDWPEGRRFLAAVDETFERSGIDLLFIDGNHDDHASLADHRHASSPVRIRDRIVYLPRGSRLQVGGIAFGFLGGAFSVDWRDRTVGRDWWPNEVVDPSDVERLGAEPLDVLVTHDAPDGVHLHSGWRLPADDQVRADESRALLAKAVFATRPRLLLHGHWHHAHQTELAWIDREVSERTGEISWASTNVVGLGCDGDDVHGWAVLDLADLSVCRPNAGSLAR